MELNALVRRSLEQCLPDEYWIQAELSDVRSNTTGHCYLEFVQKDPRSNSLIAKARGMIWNTIYRLLKPYFEETTGQPFTSGIKVLVKVTVDVYKRQPLACRVRRLEDGRLLVRFLETASAIAPGQSAVFYDGRRVLGGAFIASQRGIGLVILENEGF